MQNRDNENSEVKVSKDLNCDYKYIMTLGKYQLSQTNNLINLF